ncbi:MAG: acetyl-CoA carboxylase, biotin carboxyl carrier protein [Gammaproteobacteria bacterium RIFCSPLOWO2_02_FULL_42_14]|nr:MAG: acetyl-CoA carboxylase, biotin carboxyl carrier protein [Gammaproteobacteria bacterium RIFCSPHIGHO2_02_FULL_42_43]OGT28041.1 MAG: acetyl-CoA carboxylase, biotin carboxyl carrier protein [Gammaproteobacteria bacterium RIFCSPHIGHO2_01_FULL_42_8]OGT51694.1 MAG: acetyl-CoA carboxylase, biotin carboxyl carrier protein [Gammaproteobacteria bacterium RIFCSPHIGHO2_12_FULL_41_25]OGT61591.1 MAG: acetyl-CoA carboxylase, biotin carboxyl carrier protein [Gammaproteobacteria bacterium RIFCSPLOWO2_02_F
MDTRKIRKLIELVKETGIGELEVKSGDDCVRINCQLIAGNATPVIAATTPATATAPASTASEKKPKHTEGHTLKSPMVGTIYLSSAPGTPPFVSVGQKVKVGDTLCLIEAMKMFNKIEADKAGTISARLVENEQPVEYDQPLFIIEP